MKKKVSYLQNRKEILGFLKKNYTEAKHYKNFTLRQVPDTLEPESRTFRATFTTDDKIFRSGFFFDYYEKLLINDQIPNTERVNGIMPFLKDHRNSIDAQIGRVLSVERVDVGDRMELQGIIQIGRSKDEQKDKQYLDILDKISRGEIGNLSIGYMVRNFEEVDIVNDDSPPTFLMNDWELLEVSLVAVPADANSFIKNISGSLDFFENINKNKNNQQQKGVNIMKDKVEKDDPKVDPDKRTVTDDKNKSVDTSKIKDDAANAENERCRQIMTICDQAGLKSQDYLDKKFSVEDVRKVALQKLVEKNKDIKTAPDKNPNITVGKDGLQRKNLDFQNFFLGKAGRKIKGEGDSEFPVSMSFCDALRKYTNEPYANQRELLKRTVFTGDLSNLLTDALNKEIRRDYAEYPHAYSNLVRTRSQATTHDAKVMAVDASLVPDDMAEGQEYKYGQLKDSKDAIQIIKRGKGLAISENAFLRDDLDSLSSVIRKFGVGMRRREAQLVFGLLASTTEEVEGAPVFDAKHRNVVADTKGINITNISAAKVLMAKQTDLAGDPINIMPRHIVCAEELRPSAATFLRQNFVPTEFQNQTQVYNEGIRSVISDPALDILLGSPAAGQRWFLTGDVSEVEIIQRVVLNDYPVPSLVNMFKEEKDSMIWLMKFWVGFKIVDFRGLIRIG